MKTNNAIKCISTLGVTMGVLMLMAISAPSAHAVNLLTYYNFNTEADGAQPPYTSNSPGQQTTHLVNDATNPFPSGNMIIRTVYPPPPPPNITPAGTTLNQWPTDATGAGGALDLAGNANLTSGGLYCFDFGGITTTGQFNVTLSFAIASVGNGGQFKDLTVEWGTSSSQTVPATSYPNSVTLSPFTIGTNTHTVAYQQVTGTLTGADNEPAGTYVWVQFCFSNAGNNANGNDTLVDNIQVTGVPEPTTMIGGMLGVLGLCWFQRRWLVRSLRLRRT
jgi:PEP-CTERM motif